MLQVLTEADPDNRKHIVRLITSFEFRHHLCLVLEPM
jgi:serine/threonine-protein kinase PRP4